MARGLWSRIRKGGTSGGLRLFISYRRADAGPYASRLYNDLGQHFARDRVFVDLQSIAPGQDFVRAIEEGIGSFGTVLAVIGPRWLETDGERRLDAPHDFVRLELEIALERNAHVIPVLVGGATMPAADDLPEPLRPLARRHAVELSDARWNDDVRRLIEILGRLDDAATDVPWSGIRRLPRSSS